MGQKYKDSAKAATEADRITGIAEQNLQEVLLSFKNCLPVIHKTKRMLELDHDCICMKSKDLESKSKRRRRKLHEKANSIEIALTNYLQWTLHRIESKLVDTDGTLDRHNCLEKVGDDNLLWCDHVCVHETVDMDSALWRDTPQTILELVFARLPLHQIFQLRVLSKHWRALMTSPLFQNAFGTSTLCRFAIANPEYQTLWSFGISGREWSAVRHKFKPYGCAYASAIAGDGGLLILSSSSQVFLDEQVKQDLQLYVCNPLTQAWRKLPLPLLVQRFDLVHLVIDRRTKQYTVTVVDDRQYGSQHSSNTKAVVEVYNSSTKTWTPSTGIFQSTGTNLIYYKRYMLNKFVGIRAYDMATGYTSIPVNVPEEIMDSQNRGFDPLCQYQGQIYMLQTKADTSGISVLGGPSHEWEKICSLPEPLEILKNYFFSLQVSADVIIISGFRRNCKTKLPENCIWMLNRTQGKWIDVLDKGHEMWIGNNDYSWRLTLRYQFMFEIRFDGIP